MIAIQNRLVHWWQKLEHMLGLRYLPSDRSRAEFFECWLLKVNEDNWALKVELADRDATIARLQDLVAKFQRGGVSNLYAEGHME